MTKKKRLEDRVKRTNSKSRPTTNRGVYSSYSTPSDFSYYGGISMSPVTAQELDDARYEGDHERVHRIYRNLIDRVRHNPDDYKDEW